MNFVIMFFPLLFLLGIWALMFYICYRVVKRAVREGTIEAFEEMERRKSLGTNTGIGSNYSSYGGAPAGSGHIPTGGGFAPGSAPGNGYVPAGSGYASNDGSGGSSVVNSESLSGQQGAPAGQPGAEGRPETSREIVQPEESGKTDPENK